MTRDLSFWKKRNICRPMEVCKIEEGVVQLTLAINMLNWSIKKEVIQNNPKAKTQLKTVLFMINLFERWSILLAHCNPPWSQWMSVGHKKIYWSSIDRYRLPSGILVGDNSSLMTNLTIPNHCFVYFSIFRSFKNISESIFWRNG